MSENIKLTLIPITKKQPEYGVEVLLHNADAKWYKTGIRRNTDVKGDHYFELVVAGDPKAEEEINPTHFAYLNEK